MARAAVGGANNMRRLSWEAQTEKIFFMLEGSSATEVQNCSNVCWFLVPFTRDFLIINVGCSIHEDWFVFSLHNSIVKFIFRQTAS